MFAEAIVLLLLGLAAKCAFASATREGNPAAGAEEEAEFRRRRWWWHENRVCFLVLMAGRVPQFLFPDHVHVPIWGVFLAKLLFWWGEVTSPLLRDTLRLPLAEVPYPRDGLLTKGYLHTADPLFGVAILWLCSVPATLLALFLYIFCFLTVPGFSPAISLEMTARMVDYGLLGAYLFDCATGQLRPPDYSLTEEERLMTSTYHILDLHPVGPAAFPRGEPCYLFGLLGDVGRDQEDPGAQSSAKTRYLLSGLLCLLPGALLGRNVGPLAAPAFLVTRLAVCATGEWRGRAKGKAA